jgi:hypothetical protein
LKSRKTVQSIGRCTITIESFEDDGSELHDYGLPRPVWIRAARLIARFGADPALDLIDQRAEAAFERGDINTCRKWRDVMAAIHAISSDTPLISDRIH